MLLHLLIIIGIGPSGYIIRDSYLSIYIHLTSGRNNINKILTYYFNRFYALITYINLLYGRQILILALMLMVLYIIIYLICTFYLYDIILTYLQNYHVDDYIKDNKFFYNMAPQTITERRGLPNLQLPADHFSTSQTEEQLLKSTIESTMTNLNQFKIQEYKFAEIVKNIDSNKEMFYPKEAKPLFNEDYKLLLSKLIESNDENLKLLSKYSTKYPEYYNAISKKPEFITAAKELAKYKELK